MRSHRVLITISAMSLAIVLALAVPALGQRSVTVPVGTVVSLRMDTALSSDTSRVGDRFTATVFRAATVEGRVVIPENAKVEGHVTGATPVERGGRTATLAVAFDRMVLPAGNSVQIDGTLTSLNEDARRKMRAILDEMEFVNQLVALVLVLSAERIRIRPLLDLRPCERIDIESGAGHVPRLVDRCTFARVEPLFISAEVEIGFRQRDSLHRA